MGWEAMNREGENRGAKCQICKEPIIEGQKFYFRNEKNDLVHAVCLWNEEEQQLNKEEG